MIALSDYLIVAAILFALSVAGIFLNRKNVLLLLMCIELMLLAVNINFIAFSHYLGDVQGQIFVFFILTVAAAEAAIGLAILVVLFRTRRTINVAATRVETHASSSRQRRAECPESNEMRDAVATRESERDAPTASCSDGQHCSRSISLAHE